MRELERGTMGGSKETVFIDCWVCLLLATTHQHSLVTVMDLGLYNKSTEPRGAQGTLIGNWVEVIASSLHHTAHCNVMYVRSLWYDII
jgi:hypothetical protein